MDVARDEAAKIKEAARHDDNKFNVIKTATCGQYNIVTATNQRNDYIQSLKGQILPTDLVVMEASKESAYSKWEIISDTTNMSKMPGGTTENRRNAAIKKQQGDKAAAAKAQQNRASASNATAINVDAAGKVQTAQATNGTSSSVLAASSQSAPGFPDHLMSAAAGPMMSMFIGIDLAE